jgi:hypothetical protein
MHLPEREGEMVSQNPPAYAMQAEKIMIFRRILPSPLLHEANVPQNEQ